MTLRQHEERTRPARDSGTLASRWAPRIALLVACVVVFTLHFRPSEVGFLEEWPLAHDWGGNGGFGAFAADYWEWTLSRPLHLIPSFLGLAIGGGSPSGIFLVLAVVATLQLLAVVWALRPVTHSVWISGAVGLFLALHPLWAGGYLQRFLPAQTAALALAIMLGFVVRWLVTGRARSIVGAFVALILGFAVYPGPATVAPLLTVAAALVVQTTWRRRVIAVAVTTAASAAFTLYSLVITRLISPGGTSYELGNIEVAGVRSIRELVTLVQTTLFAQGEAVLIAVLVVALLAAVLALTGAMPHPAGWTMAGAAVLSPVTTVVYFGHTGWLVDIDRLSYVISLGLFAALVLWPLSRTTKRTLLQFIAAALLVVVSLVGGVRGVQQWQPAIALQHLLLDELAPVMHDADDAEEIIVVDRSGTFGLNSTFPLQYLASAAAVWADDDTPVRLCFPEGSAVPSGGTVCDPAVEGDFQLAKSLTLNTGNLDIYIGRQESDD